MPMKSNDIHPAAEQALALWQRAGAAVTAHRGGPNVVLEVLRVDDAPIFLRLTPDSHRGREHVLAELEFVQFLGADSGPVATAIPAGDGALVHSIAADGQTFHAAAFAAAPGSALTWSDHAHNRALCSAIGEALGRIHTLSMRYTPRIRRFDWRDDRTFRSLPDRLPDFETPIKRRAGETFAFLDSLAETPQSFGLIHGDFVPANLRVREQRVTAFDFDDCCYHFYLFDFAVALLPASRLPAPTRSDYLQSMLQGYALHCAIDQRQLHIEEFWRACCLWRYLHALRNWDLVNLSDSQIKDLSQRREAVVSPITW
jgi:Ser/Thr protein kinase RdoA (MazF antagonist)